MISSSGVLAQSRIKVAAIGDSVTEGLGLEKEEAYPAVLQRLLGEAYAVENFGKSGATLLNRGHNPYVRTEAYQKLLLFPADIAVIHLGLNDTDPRNFPLYRDEFVRDYLRLIDTLRAARPGMKIFVCKMTPVFTGHPRFSSSTFQWYHLIQELIAQVAETRQLPVIDFFSALHGRPDLFTDGPTLHPNAEGAVRIAEVVKQHITGDFGGLQLPPVFGNHMVVQRDEPFRVWGRANARVTVTVRWRNKAEQVQSKTDGTWEVTFPSAAASFSPETLQVEADGKTVTFRNVLVGDVWLAAGQSNMEFRLQNAFRGDSLASLAHPSIRLLQFESYARTDAVTWDPAALQRANTLDFFSGEWVENSPDRAATFSAVAYAFAHDLARHRNVPLGIIHLSVGGSPQLAWLPRLSLEVNPAFVQALHPWRKSDYLMAWCRERATKNVGSTTSPFQQHPYAPAYIFEAGIKPLVPFALKGVIWYQGESDAENAELYRELFPYFVQEWRRQWKRPELPFLYVQLSSMERPSWPVFRDTQRLLLGQLPHTGMVVTSDIGEPHDVHPREKIIVGQRLARWALNRVYGEKGLPSGPLFSGYSRRKGHIEVDFKYADGLATGDGGEVCGFMLETREGKQIPATARIVKGKVRIDDLPEAVALLYGWSPVSKGNLVNTTKLPASTFKTPIK